MLKTVMSGSSKENKINVQDSSFYVTGHAVFEEGGGCGVENRHIPSTAFPVD